MKEGISSILIATSMWTVRSLAGKENLKYCILKIELFLEKKGILIPKGNYMWLHCELFLTFIFAYIAAKTQNILKYGNDFFLKSRKCHCNIELVTE